MHGRPAVALRRCPLFLRRGGLAVPVVGETVTTQPTSTQLLWLSRSRRSQESPRPRGVLNKTHTKDVRASSDCLYDFFLSFFSLLLIRLLCSCAKALVLLHDSSQKGTAMTSTSPRKKETSLLSLSSLLFSSLHATLVSLLCADSATRRNCQRKRYTETPLVFFNE